jgi:hypothetical protein
MSTPAVLPELTGHDDADLLISGDLLIGDVARLSGLSIDTLRYYDRAGLLGAVHRDSGGRRASSTRTPWACWMWCCGCGERACR